MRIVLILVTVLTIVGCSRQAEPVTGSKATSPNVKISVMQSGKILIDGTESTIAQVERRLVQLKSEGGAVWYYREAGHQEPPPEAMQVIRLVAKSKLPVTLSSKPDFSDYVGKDGQSRPRN